MFKITEWYSSVQQVIGHLTNPSPCQALRGGSIIATPCIDYYYPPCHQYRRMEVTSTVKRGVCTTCEMQRVETNRILLGPEIAPCRHPPIVALHYPELGINPWSLRQIPEILEIPKSTCAHIYKHPHKNAAESGWCRLRQPVICLLQKTVVGWW
jgi:hypothetical protein